jgi:hypothetical protein
MHRDHWLPDDDRTKIFQLFGCSLTHQVSHLTPAPGCSLTPIASSLSPASGILISLEFPVGSEVETRRNALVWGLAASLRFHW